MLLRMDKRPLLVAERSRIGRLAVVLASLATLASIQTATSSASHLGPPSGPPSAVLPTVSQPPPEPPPGVPGGPPAPPATPPGALVEPTESDVFLIGRRISVSLACQRSGVMRLALRKQRLGSDRFGCEGFAALATVKLRRAVARGLAKKLAKRDRLRLRARFKLGDEVLAARLNLRRASSGSADRSGRAGLWWNTGYLSCGSQFSAPPYLNVKAPGYTALGYGNTLGFFVNDTSYTDWVAYRPWLYEYGHGWREPPYDWVGWFEVPPGQGVNAITQGLNWPSGRNAYLTGAVEVYWYYGAKDWNWLYASPPGDGVGSTVYDNYWCYVP